MIHKDTPSRAEQKERDLNAAIRGRWGNEDVGSFRQAKKNNNYLVSIALLLIGILFLSLMIFDFWWPLKK